MLTIKDSVVDKQIQQSVAAVEKIENAWGHDSQRLMPALKNLGDLYFAVGMYPEAESVFWRYLSITAKHFGDTHPIVAGSLQFVAEAFEAQGLFSEAERYYLWALDAKRRAGAPVEDLVEQYARLVHLYRQAKEYVKASITEEQLVAVLKIRTHRLKKSPGAAA